jgi:hypothetical protein
MQKQYVKPLFLLFWDFFWIFILKNDINVASKSQTQEKILLKNYFFLLASWRSMTKTEGSGSEAWNRVSGSGSTPKCHGSATLSLTNGSGSRSEEQKNTWFRIQNTSVADP